MTQGSANVRAALCNITFASSFTAPKKNQPLPQIIENGQRGLARITGKGLRMKPFPPKRFVRRPRVSRTLRAGRTVMPLKIPSSRRRRKFLHASPDVPCRFCAIGRDTLEHALVGCPAHSQSRQRWYFSTSGSVPLTLHTLFSTDPNVNRARDILRNIAFAAHVCRAADACEI